jgi:ribosomal protein S18 acetylase RimI-like enzyme
MARLRAADRPSEEAWTARISAYLAGEHHPQHALIPRVSYAACESGALVGYIAGHLTSRYGCAGELQWINVSPGQRGSGVATELLRRLAKWFVQHKAFRVCVNVDPANATARRFYAKHGAEKLAEQWMVWNDISSVLGKLPSHKKPTG